MNVLTEYVKETRSELKHVSWPSRKVTIALTVLVIVLSLIVAAYLGALDSLFAKFIQAIININN